MNLALLAAAVACMLVTGFLTLSAIVFCLGMGANAKPGEIRALKLWMLAFGLLGAGGVVASILALRAGEERSAWGYALAPSAVILVVFLWAIRK